MLLHLLVSLFGPDAERSRESGPTIPTPIPDRGTAWSCSSIVLLLAIEEGIFFVYDERTIFIICGTSL